MSVLLRRPFPAAGQSGVSTDLLAEPLTAQAIGTAPVDVYGAAVWADSPVSYYRLDESSGSPVDAVTGAVGSHNAGVLVGQAGKITTGLAASYDGLNDYSLVSAPGLGTNLLTATFECWLKTTTGVRSAIAGTLRTGTSSIFGVYLNTVNDVQTAGKTEFHLRDAAGVTLRGNIGEAIYDGAWHHLVFQTASSTTINAWVDGQPATVTHTIAGPIATFAEFDFATALGARDNRGTAELFAAVTLDEVAFYTTRLSQTRVQAHYAAAQPLTTSAQLRQPRRFLVPSSGTTIGQGRIGLGTIGVRGSVGPQSFFLTLSATSTTATAVVRRTGTVRAAASSATAAELLKPAASRTATATTSASRVARANAVRATTSTSSATLAGVRARVATLTATASSAVTIVRATARTAAATSSSTATAVRQARAVRSVTSTSSPSVASARMKLATLAATSTAAASSVRLVTAARSVTAAATATARRDVAHALQVTSASTATVAAIKAKLFALTVTATATSTASRLTQAARTATSTTSATAVRQARATRAATSTSTAAVPRATARALQATSIETASIAAIKAKLLALTATASSAPVVVRSARAVRAAQGTTSATVARVTAASKATIATTTAALTRGPRKVTTASSAASATFQAVKLKVVALTATASSAVTTARAISAQRVATSATVVTVRRALARGYAATVAGTATSAVGRVAQLALAVTVSGAASFVTGAAQHLKRWIEGRGAGAAGFEGATVTAAVLVELDGGGPPDVDAGLIDGGAPGDEGSDLDGGIVVPALPTESTARQRPAVEPGSRVLAGIEG